MESAVLFQVAQDFSLHAATILQTVSKESKKERAYEGHTFTQAIEMEEKVFFDYVLDTLVKL